MTTTATCRGCGWTAPAGDWAAERRTPAKIDSAATAHHDKTGHYVSVVTRAAGEPGPLAQMADEVSGIGLSLYRGKGTMPDYLITTADGRTLHLSVTEWVGLVDLADKWRENA